MKKKQTLKEPEKAKKATAKSGVQNLRVTERQSKDVKGGALRSGR